ncbi:MAG: type II toxin-antitoxin system VapC family toxin [Anaerolineae bacterium]
MPYVLDSHALLAYLNQEEPAPRVGEILEEVEQGGDPGFLSLINYGEVVYIVERERGLELAHQTIAWLDALPLQVVMPDREITLLAAHIKANHPISYADSFGAALALREDAKFVTGDKEFEALKGLIEIQWI